MNHFTNLAGHNAISSQVTWTFRAAKPPCGNPIGAYFTTLRQDDWALANKLRIPKSKLEFCFSFTDLGDLISLRGGRGKHVFYSVADYPVDEQRQRGCTRRAP